MTRKSKRRNLHWAIICPYREIGQVGCTWGVNKADAMSNLADKCDTVKRMAKKDCPVCKEFDGN